jgi:hypothetical protein
VGITAKAAQEKLHLLVDHGVVGHEMGKVGFLGGVGQLPFEQQIAGFQKITLGGQLLNRIAAVQELAFVAVDIGDVGLAGCG